MSNKKHTRKVKFEKRRKNTKFTSLILVIGVILFISLTAIWLFGGGSEVADDSETEEQEVKITQENDDNETDVKVNEKEEEEAISQKETQHSVKEEKQDEQETIDEDEDKKNDENKDETTNNDQDVVIEEVESSDENVLKAYEGDWEPVGTIQEGPHTVTYDSGSQDRKEMKKAILLATGLNGNDYTVWWIGNGGDQKVIATVSDKAESEIYRVYLSWVDEEGWKPTRVEELKENDKK
ncbi:YrrS family protein [Oceanobacillus senegalensis]|uniref:YrrS family protein n=1 Tax=Oceanobacillus senegalensis TaxID=1936063 RepID=UPI000A30B95B|nr:YrrS family protein [Oceanobacillus senegalensis]